ncbi:MAG TPA: hypothetical protein VNN80_34840 [Polyangiaceae bacterium]|jgi:hypothetical protein|nr:hypothetical protein [Polyangiaceae bacterium]
MSKDDDAPEERRRVYGKIAPLILMFARDRAGQQFHVEQLRQYVDAHAHDIAPDSPGRILRELRQQRLLNYVVIDRRNSLYQFRKPVLARP